MCMSCAMRELTRFETFGPAGPTVHYAGGTGKSVNPDARVLPRLLPNTAVIDTVGGDASTTATLQLGTPVVSSINTIGDEDFYKIELVADRTYEFGPFAEVGGPGGVPLADSFVELYEADGSGGLRLLGSADGGASTMINTINSGFDAILQVTATKSGAYYVNARAFDNTPLDGRTKGDMVGDYRLTATDVTDLPRYVPYYDLDSPLHSLD